MNWLTRWHLLERFWEPVRRRLFLARQLRTERDYWKERAEKAERCLYPPCDESVFEVGPPPTPDRQPLPLTTSGKCGYEGCPGGSDCPGHVSTEPITKGQSEGGGRRPERLQSGAQVLPPPTEGPPTDAPAE